MEMNMYHVGHLHFIPWIWNLENLKKIWCFCLVTPPTLPPTGICRPGEAVCRNLQCINADYRCDGDRDCEDGSDEDPNICNCTYINTMFTYRIVGLLDFSLLTMCNVHLQNIIMIVLQYRYTDMLHLTAYEIQGAKYELLQCMRPSSKKCLFGNATWGFLDPGRREGNFFFFSKIEV